MQVIDLYAPGEFCTATGCHRECDRARIREVKEPIFKFCSEFVQACLRSVIEPAS
jgi:hypothetical protein